VLDDVLAVDVTKPYLEHRSFYEIEQAALDHGTHQTRGGTYRLPATSGVRKWSGVYIVPRRSESPLSSLLNPRSPDMMRRRRPLRRAAVVGGVAAAAHHAGKRSAEAQANEQYQNDQINDLQQQQQYAQPQYAPPPPAPTSAGHDVVAELTSLKGLLDQGVLTQAEFDAQKQKVLNG